jgi:HKD family nuclease
MPNITLLATPDGSYLQELEKLIERSQSFTLITGFASPAGVALISKTLEGFFGRPETRGTLIVPVDRQGFNTEGIFDSLLKIKAKAGKRLELRVVPQMAGLLHAKAALGRHTSGADILLGSANLTKMAFQSNHELGLLITHVPPDVVTVFQQFVTSLAAFPVGSEQAESVLSALGYRSAALEQRPISEDVQRALTKGWDELLEVLQAGGQVAAEEQEPQHRLIRWIEAGYLVGKGRRGTDALVIRIPTDSLQQRGLLAPVKRSALGEAAREWKSFGYALELVKPDQAAEVRKAARRVTSLLARLSLSLPCFGSWMPATYWDLFQSERNKLRGADVLAPSRIEELVAEQRAYLDRGGLEESIAQILRRLEDAAALEPKNRKTVETYLRGYLERELESRRPAVVASGIEFRTARQRWAPFEQTEMPYRQLMVDVIQGTFASTFRTGDWPSRFRSHAAREVAGQMADRLRANDRAVDGHTAQTILQQAATWEDAARPFADVVAEFGALVPEMDFPPPSDLDSGIDDDAQGDDDA